MGGKPVTKEKALERMASLCSRSEQCEFELLRKLSLWGISSQDKKEILEYLRHNRFVDDLRYAKSFANDKARFSAWGPYKIKAELLKRQIKSTQINEALHGVQPGIWKEALLKSAKSKAAHLRLSGEEGYADRRKLFNYLIGRGFSSSTSSKAVALMRRNQENTGSDNSQGRDTGPDN